MYPGTIEEGNKSPASRYTRRLPSRVSAAIAVKEAPDTRSIAAEEARRRVRTRVLRRSLNPDVFSRVIGRKKESAIDDRCFLFARSDASDLFLFFCLSSLFRRDPSRFSDLKLDR